MKKTNPVHFARYTKNSAELNYFTCEQEILAVIYALKLFIIHLLLSRYFELFTVHKA